MKALSRLSVVGLIVLVGALAMGVTGASAKIVCKNGQATCAVTATVTGTTTFSIGAAKISCPVSTISGTATNGASSISTASANVTFGSAASPCTENLTGGNCTVNTGAAGTNWTVTSTSALGSGSFGLSITLPQVLISCANGCTITVSAQTLSHGSTAATVITYTNATTSLEVSSGVAFTSNFVCQLGGIPASGTATFTGKYSVNGIQLA